MGKSLFIAEKPSVAMEFARVLGENMTRHDGYQESERILVTWCVGHLVTMSYPEAYDPALKKWSLQTLPFIPEQFRYEIIPQVKKQFAIVKDLLNRSDVDTIYVCTDSGREGEYIYRLVAQMAGVDPAKKQKRVWIDSQTEEEIRRGVREAKDLSEYNNLSESAYLRAKEDYLMGINFSRLLTLVYGDAMASYLGERFSVISVGRVMTCVLGMVVRREREIRSFVKTPFYRVMAGLDCGESPAGNVAAETAGQAGLAGEGKTDRKDLIEAEFKAVAGSAYENSPKLYKENGFKLREDAQALIDQLRAKVVPLTARVDSVTRKKENKNPPLLYNLAELQNDCSRLFHISPDQTLNIVQELYEKKLVTYPRTDARVLSTAAAKEIARNIRGLTGFGPASPYANEILEQKKYEGLAKTRYVNDKQITDHYALVPTGSGLGALRGLKGTAYGVYCTIVRRFLQIFYPPAVYLKLGLTADIGGEKFFASQKVLLDEGYQRVMKQEKKQDPADPSAGMSDPAGQPDNDGESREEGASEGLIRALEKLKKGSVLPVQAMQIREGETSPPKRYNSGSMMLAMENAGQLIEDEELRAQIKGSGIGTSATRGEILKKLLAIKYLDLNTKTQILTPTLRGEMVFDIVNQSIRSLLNPDLTASWEKGLTYVADGSITPEEYMVKLDHFIRSRTQGVLGLHNRASLKAYFDAAAANYTSARSRGTTARGGGKNAAAGRKRGKAE